MIRYYKKIDGKIIELESETDSSWINISPPFAQGELERFSESFDFPLDFLTDSLDIDERSRYEREEHANLILFKY